MTDLSKFCDEWLAAWTGNRPDHLLTFYVKDAFYRDPAQPKGLKGHDALLPYFKNLLAVNPEWTWKALEIFPTDGGFTLKWEAKIPTKNGIVSETGLDIVEMENGKIVRNEVYFDTKQLSAASS